MLRVLLLVISLFLPDVAAIRPKLLVLSLDGFSQAYLNDVKRFSPWLRSFMESGIYVDNIESVFPSETWPDHFTMATGLYPEAHGIVANEFYDTKLGKSFSFGPDTLEFWNGGEPLWITARRQGYKTATSNWPGDQVSYEPGGLKASLDTNYKDLYEANAVSFEKRIDEAVAWFQGQNVDLAFVHHSEPDMTAHYHGVTSKMVQDQLDKLDWYLGYLFKKVADDAELAGNLNIIICADHGMADITKTYFLEDFLSFDDEVERVPYFGPFAHVFPKTGKEESVFAKLQKAQNKDWTVFKKENIPERLHYSNNDRIAPIVVIGNIGVFILPTSKTNQTDVAGHGWDPVTYKAQMSPIFMANGPLIKQAGRLAIPAQFQMSIKDVYAVVCKVFNLEPNPNNATFEIAELVVKSNGVSPNFSSNVIYLAVIFVALSAI